MRILSLMAGALFLGGLALTGCRTQLNSAAGGYEPMLVPPIKDLTVDDTAELWFDFKGQASTGIFSDYQSHDFFEQAGLDLVWQTKIGIPYLYGNVGFSGWLGEFNIANNTQFTPPTDHAFNFYGGTGQLGFMIGWPIHEIMLFGVGLQIASSYEAGEYAAFRAQSAQTDYVIDDSPSPWSGSLGINVELTRYWPQSTMRIGVVLGLEDFNLLGYSVVGRPGVGWSQTSGDLVGFDLKAYWLLRVQDAFLGISLHTVELRSLGISVEVGTKLF